MMEVGSLKFAGLPSSFLNQISRWSICMEAFVE